MGKLVEVKDVVHAVLDLAQAGQVTGEVLHVDGGSHAGVGRGQIVPFIFRSLNSACVGRSDPRDGAASPGDFETAVGVLAVGSSAGFLKTAFFR
jgi:hypothetical protein